MAPKPIVLIVLDGWGYSKESKYNAINQSDTPVWDKLPEKATCGLLYGSGLDVGLPEGQMGNSEVGHMNLGAGRVVMQDLPKINQAIENKSFFQNDTLLNCLQEVKTSNKALHIFGLLSEGGVHSHEKHIFAMIEMAAQQGIDKVYCHAFLDGRDTPPQSAEASLKRLMACFDEHNCGQVASIMGRYYAMDRDNRWDRVEKAFRCITKGESHAQFTNPIEALHASYEQEATDEFVEPSIITDAQGQAIPFQDGDSIIFMNFRADRARQLTKAFIEDDFDGFERQAKPQIGHFVSLTRYAKTLETEVAFPPAPLTHVLGACLAENGLTQLRIAETEKYAHVTFFFNGGVEQVFEGEDRILVPSPKVATYDLQPEMSAPEMTDKLVDDIANQRHDVIICNFANADMVGHTGDFEATKKAIACLDICLGRICQALESVGGECIITADHGNAEIMFNDETQQPHTAHTSEPVPFVYLGREAQMTTDNGKLSDIAPTILYLLGLEQPSEMTGQSLLKGVKPC